MHFLKNQTQFNTINFKGVEIEIFEKSVFNYHKSKHKIE